jgi:hypothetical protein
MAVSATRDLFSLPSIRLSAQMLAVVPDNSLDQRVGEEQ